MKIFLVITTGDLGGAQNFLINLAIGLKAQGHQVFVGFGDGEYLEKKLVASGISYQKFPYLKRTNNPFNNLLFIWQLKKFLDCQQFDVIHFNSSNALLGAISNYWSKNKARSVFTVHGLSLLDNQYQAARIIKKIYLLLFKLLLKLIDKIVFVSQNNLKVANKIGLTNKGEVIYNGLDIERLNFYQKDEARKRLSEKISQDLSVAYLIGSIGRLSAQKNYSFLINNFRAILEIKPNAKLVIIGTGPEAELCQRLIIGNNLSSYIFLVGTLPEAHRYLKAFDLFVLPSIYEGLPLVLIEAQAAQISILATDVGGNSEIVCQTEKLFKVNNVNDFINKFQAQFLTSHIVEHLDEKFMLDKMIKKYISTYQN
ncbi:MAG: glycosyltransferase [bacterium]|nr:glycosyltransferase [bacterium]